MSEIQKVVQFPSITNVDNLSLAQLGESANREALAGDEAFVKGLLHYKACGEYLNAAKAKGKAEIGTSFRWSEWLKTNWGKSDTTAKRFMQLATNWDKLQSMHGLFSEEIGINSALKLLSVQPDTIDVEVIETEVIKEVVTEVIKEIERPNTVPKSEVEKLNADLKKAKAEIQNKDERIRILEELASKNQKYTQVIRNEDISTEDISTEDISTEDISIQSAKALASINIDLDKESKSLMSELFRAQLVPLLKRYQKCEILIGTERQLVEDWLKISERY
jgi:hypothetical protein